MKQINLYINQLDENCIDKIQSKLSIKTRAEAVRSALRWAAQYLDDQPANTINYASFIGNFSNLPENTNPKFKKHSEIWS